MDQLILYYGFACLFGLAGFRFSSSMIPLAHFPSLLLLVGFPVFWLELFCLRQPGGHASWLATVLVAVLLILLLSRSLVRVCAGPHSFRADMLPRLPGFLLLCAGLSAGLIIAISLAASFLPPHLPQESDAINYHITMPRQHLILGSLAHIPWSTADLYFAPLDYALAPFWLATELPNKWPQEMFFFGILLIVFRLALRSGASRDGAWLAVAATLGCHALTIQAGTAMLDLVIVYCFFAAWDSMLEKRYLLGCIEFTFCFWAKSFMPLLMIALFLGAGLIYLLLKVDRLKVRERINGGLKKIPRRCLVYPVICSLFIAGPFMGRSVVYGATPLYPFFAGSVTAVSVEGEVIDKAHQALASRDDYGLGRGASAFIKHFFVLSVPTKGVNNEFDYPLGLTYLLFIGPFLWFALHSVLRRTVSMPVVVVLVYWMLWWAGSQQSRFLIIPLVLIFIIMAVEWKFPSRVLWVCVILGLVLEMVSMVGAHRYDWGKSGQQVLRAQDRDLVDESRNLPPGSVLVTHRHDVAFSSVAVDIRNGSGVFVINR